MDHRGNTRKVNGQQATETEGGINESALCHYQSFLVGWERFLNGNNSYHNILG